ncbi:hypothetical protein MGYG_07826 [Nannizzia gypsea CBS 118893]|uniref:Chromosome condensation protein n=1 Tax=Arthroderma gypseum (strain ATCC MYA-4604 / CBS 118893) TaxID=535722 RepID=E4V495_ARTGP|nr:hypothetical protein MGYG_07826 [Nannizzia gypsea CBS 118893]EFR04819.1 hypothetical protein MGYG_07826 [Nannizzia gypsea CBS 118893]
MKQGRSGAGSSPDAPVQDQRGQDDASYELETIGSRTNLERRHTVNKGRDTVPDRRNSSVHREPSALLESAESCISTPEHTQSELKLSHHATQLYTISYLVFFSIFGTLARIGLQVLTVYPGAPVTTGVVWANVGGCLLIGFFAEDRKLFREEWGDSSVGRGELNGNGDEQQRIDDSDDDDTQVLTKHKAVKKTIPLYIGLTTGFCGSFTSFSSFMLDAYHALSNTLPNPNTDTILPRNGGYSFMAVLAVLLYTVLLCLSSIVVGAHLADGLSYFTPTLPFKFLRNILDRLIVLLAVGCWMGAIFLAIWTPDRHRPIQEQHWRGSAEFAIIFAPIGCLFRFYASLYFNPLILSFPLGTFLVNMIGTLILGICFDLQHASSVVARTSINGAIAPHRLLGCQILKGIMNGFCGCTTTVSTWIAELHSLRLKHAYLYGFASVGLGLALLVVVIGTMQWTVGLAQPAC